MSRVGKKTIAILPDVKVDLKDQLIEVKGPLGSLNFEIPAGISLEIKDNEINVNRNTDSREDRAFHGLTRTLIANMIEGVKVGYKKTLIVDGIGYRREISGKSLVLEVGFSHSIVFRMPEGINITVENPNKLTVAGVSKQLVGDVAAAIRKVRPPEPYKGKGIRYEGEHIRRKAGKTATSSS